MTRVVSFQVRKQASWGSAASRLCPTKIGSGRLSLLHPPPFQVLSLGLVLCFSRSRLSGRSPWNGHTSRVKLPGAAKERPPSLANRTRPVPGLGHPGRRGKEVSPPNGRRAAGPTSSSLPLPPSAPPPPARTKPSPRRGPQRPRAPRLTRLPRRPELQSRTRRARSPRAPPCSLTPLPSTARARADRAPRPRWRPPNSGPRGHRTRTSRRRRGAGRPAQVWAPLRPRPQNQSPDPRKVLPRTCGEVAGHCVGGGGERGAGTPTDPPSRPARASVPSGTRAGAHMHPGSPQWGRWPSLQSHKSPLLSAHKSGPDRFSSRPFGLIEGSRLNFQTAQEV